MAVRLVLSDIDGTIKPRGGAISTRTIAAFHKALDAGLVIGPATGRDHDWVPRFFGGDAACCATCLATNGLQLYHEGRLVHEERQPKEGLERARAVLAAVPGAGMLCFDGPTPLIVSGSREVLGRLSPEYAAVARDLGHVPEGPVVKTNVFFDGDYEATRALVALLTREVPELDFDVAGAGLSNVMPHGYNKGTAVLELCRLLGVGRDEVVVFGDADNDLTMFSVVENSVAVAGATPAAREAARWHVGRCEDDAVAAAIEALAAGEWPFAA